MRLLHSLTCICFIQCLPIHLYAQEHVNAESLGKLVYSDLTVEVDKESAKKVLENFGLDLGILMNVIWKKGGENGVDQTIPLTFVFKQKPALQVLEEIVAQLSEDGNATWQLRNGALEIGLKSSLAIRGRQRLEIYYIRDLTFTIRQFSAPEIGSFGDTGDGNTDSTVPSQDEKIQDIIDLIVTFVEPELWEQHGGSCTIVQYKNSLLIRAPDFIHRQINGYSFKAKQPEDVRERRVLYQKDKTKVVVDRLPIH